MIQLTLCSSNMNWKEEEQRQWMERLQEFDITLSPSWTPECTHLMMPRLQVTQKVIYALQSQRAIITPQWVETLLEALQGLKLRSQTSTTDQSSGSFMRGFQWPDYRAFLPPIHVDVGTQSQMKGDWFPDDGARSQVFQNVHFIATDTKQHDRVQSVIQGSNGTLTLLPAPPQSKQELINLLNQHLVNNKEARKLVLLEPEKRAGQSSEEGLALRQLCARCGVPITQELLLNQSILFGRLVLMPVQQGQGRSAESVAPHLEDRTVSSVVVPKSHISTVGKHNLSTDVDWRNRAQSAVLVESTRMTDTRQQTMPVSRIHQAHDSIQREGGTLQENQFKRPLDNQDVSQKRPKIDDPLRVKSTSAKLDRPLTSLPVSIDEMARTRRSEKAKEPTPEMIPQSIESRSPEPVPSVPQPAVDQPSTSVSIKDKEKPLTSAPAQYSKNLLRVELVDLCVASGANPSTTAPTSEPSVNFKKFRKVRPVQGSIALHQLIGRDQLASSATKPGHGSTSVWNFEEKEKESNNTQQGMADQDPEPELVPATRFERARERQQEPTYTVSSRPLRGRFGGGPKLTISMPNQPNENQDTVNDDIVQVNDVGRNASNDKPRIASVVEYPPTWSAQNLFILVPSLPIVNYFT